MPHEVSMRGAFRLALIGVIASCGPPVAASDPVLDRRQIDAPEPVDVDDYFGSALTAVGDLNGDGVPDLVVGAQGDDDGAVDAGAIWVLLLQSDGTATRSRKISATEGGFTGVLDPVDRFGGAVTTLGDLDGDGMVEIAVGASWDDDGGVDRGAVWILSLDRRGSVARHAKISDTDGNFGGQLQDRDSFGDAVAGLGDLDGDGVPDLAVGARGVDGPGGEDSGAAWVLFLEPDGRVREHRTITEGMAGFTGDLDPDDRFGRSAAAVGDLDGNGITDLAVGAVRDDDGGEDRGAIYLLMLAPDGTVVTSRKISDTQGGFHGLVFNHDRFGDSVSGLGDLDLDGQPDIVVGAATAHQGDGAIWVLFLNDDGSVRDDCRIDPTNDHGRFGWSSALIGGSLDGQTTSLAVGEPFLSAGAVTILFLDDHDCNENGVADELDVELGTSDDCDGDGRPDECVAPEQDCNGNLVPDACDLERGTSPDCNGNGRPDECDLVGDDCNDNGVPDACELDCNCNGLDDLEEIAADPARDCDSDLVPNECDTAANDTCGTNLTLLEGTTAIDCFVNATGSGVEPPACPGALVDSDVWFRFQSVAGGIVTIAVDADFPVTIAVYEAGCPDPNDDAIACDVGASGAALLSLGTREAVIHRVRVGGASNPLGEASITLTIDRCPADVTDDGQVDADDLVAVILGWGSGGTETGGDVDGSGHVDVDDLLAVLASWGPCR